MREHTGAHRARAAVLAAACLATATFAAQARVIHVPAEVATIQGAIDAAVNGDRVLVSPGTYLESIDFNGKAITVASEKGAEVTIIDAGGQRSVALFHSGETRRSVLRGFTLRNGNAADYPLTGGGVAIYQASPTIENNVVTDSSACSGNGIAVYFSSALVRNNHVHNNRQRGCGGGTVGGGILVSGADGAEISDNLIENNQTDLAGGGIGMNGAGTALIAGVMTLLMGVVANYPLALATGLGLNAFVTFGIAKLPEMTWADAMGLVVMEGVIILVLVLTGFRQAVFRAIPSGRAERWSLLRRFFEGWFGGLGPTDGCSAESMGLAEERLGVGDLPTVPEQYAGVLDEAGECGEQAGLAGADLPDQQHQLAGLHGEVDAADADRAVVVYRREA